MKKIFLIVMIMNFLFVICCGNSENISEENKISSEIVQGQSALHLHEAEKYLSACDYENAVDEAEKAININIKNFKAYNICGIAYENFGEYEKSVQNFNMALEINPKFFEAYNNRGNCYIKMGKYELAIKDFSKVLVNNPENVEAWKNRGKCYKLLGKDDKADYDFKKAKEIELKEREKNKKFLR